MSTEEKKSSGNFALRFLQSWNGQPLGKTFYGDGRVVGAPKSKFYRAVIEEHFASPSALFERLTEATMARDLAPMTAALTPSGRDAMEHGLELVHSRLLPSNPGGSCGVGIRRKFTADEGYQHPHLVAQASPVLFVDIDDVRVTATDDSWQSNLSSFARMIIANFLPPVFQDVSCWASLSASSGMKKAPSGDWLIGLHLIFVAEAALDGDLRQTLVFLDRPDVDPADGKVDPGPLLCTQLFYIAAPEFLEGAIDPVRERVVTLTGTHDFVPVSRSKLAAYRAARPQGALGNRSDGLFPTEPGYRGYLALLGDGEGLSGFHGPLRSAIASLATGVGQELDWEATKEELRQRIDEAPKAPGRESDIVRYTSDAYLDESFRGALAKFAQAKTAPRRYAPPTGTLEEAERTAEELVKSFFIKARRSRPEKA